MKKEGDFLERYFELIPEAINLTRWINWCDVKSILFMKKIILLGSTVANALMKQRLADKGIDVFDEIDIFDSTLLEDWLKKYRDIIIEENLFFLVPEQEYPANELIYLNVKRIFNLLGEKRINAIRDFSSGFPLGAEDILNDKTLIQNVFTVLKDDISKICFTEYLYTAISNYHWNMDIKENNFGIADKKSYEKRKNYILSTEDFDKYVRGRNFLFCSTRDWDKNNPIFSSASYKYLLFLFPIRLSRMKLHELYDYESDSINICDCILSDKDGEKIVDIRKYSGGTPLEYLVTKVKVNTCSIESISKRTFRNYDTIMIEMGDEFEDVLIESYVEILNNNTTLIVCGFGRVSELWKSISIVNKYLKDYVISLRRYETENIISGYLIIAEKG